MGPERKWLYMSSQDEPTEQSAEISSDAAAPAESQVQVGARRLTLNDFTRTTIRLNASDLHIQSDSVPMIRVDGRARFLDCPPATDAQMSEYIAQIMKDEKHRKALEEIGSVDLAYVLADGSARFRVSIFHSRGKQALVMRRIVAKIPDFDELNLPKQVEELTTNNRGIIIVSGTTGSGKSTTLAAMIGKINRPRAERIITIEDPIEYQHDNQKSLVSQ